MATQTLLRLNRTFSTSMDSAMRTPQVLRALVLLSTAMNAPIATARADIITYTFSGQGSGTLGSTTFTDASYSIVLTGNTANVMPALCTGIPGIFSNCNLTASIFITDLGTNSFMGLPMYVFSAVGFNGVGEVGVGNFGNPFIDSDLLYVIGVPGMADYRLATDFGPVTGTSTLLFKTPFATSGGSLTLNATSTVTFQSVIVTPEPATIVLVVTGLLAMVGVASRRNKSLS